MLPKHNDVIGTLFPLGRMVVTCGIEAAVAKSAAFGLFVSSCLFRHARGDWGDLCEEDRKENAFSLANGYRLLSSYKDEAGNKVWIITEADRSVTTVLFPDEY